METNLLVADVVSIRKRTDWQPCLQTNRQAQNGQTGNPTYRQTDRLKMDRLETLCHKVD